MFFKLCERIKSFKSSFYLFKIHVLRCRLFLKLFYSKIQKLFSFDCTGQSRLFFNFLSVFICWESSAQICSWPLATLRWHSLWNKTRMLQFIFQFKFISMFTDFAPYETIKIKLQLIIPKLSEHDIGAIEKLTLSAVKRCQDHILKVLVITSLSGLSRGRNMFGVV